VTAASGSAATGVVCYVTVTLVTFDKQSNGRRIVVVTSDG